MYKVWIHLSHASQAIEFDAYNLYIKGPYTCILYKKDGKFFVDKYPTSTIFRIKEEYLYTGGD